MISLELLHVPGFEPDFFNDPCHFSDNDLLTLTGLIRSTHFRFLSYVPRLSACDWNFLYLLRADRGNVLSYLI